MASSIGLYHPLRRTCHLPPIIQSATHLMTQPESPKMPQEAEIAAASPDSDAETAAEVTPPEPWTPAKVREWNAYYDLYVVLGVLLLAFVASANKISNSSLWGQLKVGQVMAEKGTPFAVADDPFSYTEQ